MEALRAVVVYDDGAPIEGLPDGECGYAMLAHNLSKWDAERLAERLHKQYGYHAYVVAHTVYHDDEQRKGAPECNKCVLLMEGIVEAAQGIKLKGGKA